MHLALLAVIGAFFGFANPLIQFPPAVLLFPACLALLALNQPSVGRAFRQGWLTGAVAYGASMYWVSVPVHYYGHLNWLFALPCPVLLGLYMGLYAGLFCAGMRLISVRLGWLGFGAFAGLWWALLEALRGTLFTGFYWLTLPQAFSPWPQTLQAAAYIGAFGVCALMVAGACWPAASAISGRSKSWPLVASLALFAALALFGGWRYGQPVQAAKTARIGVAQANIDQSQKWDPEFQNTTVERYLGLTRAVLETQDAELVIWPETALPFYLQENQPLSRQVLDFARDQRVALLAGAPGYTVLETPEEFAYYNRAYLVGPEGAILDHYDKVHLLPFGEYVPLKWLLGFLSQLAQGEGEFTAGHSWEPLRHDDLAMGMLICYEVIFPELTRKRVAAGANLLINISNDAWFGRTSAPAQHLNLSVLRSIEEGRYLIRGTNTGISAFIDPRGRVLVRSELFRAQALGAEVGLLDSLTVFHRIAPWLAPLASLALALLAGKALIRPRPGYQPPRAHSRNLVSRRRLV